MSGALSPNTQAVLLLTAPLLTEKSRPAAVKPLTLGEYNRLAAYLHQILQCQPADLLGSDSEARLAALPPSLALEPDRLRQLLARGLLLSQVVTEWQSRSIWVVSRADPLYPKRLKQRLNDKAPPLLYGCGSPDLLSGGGWAIVGSRDADDSRLHTTRELAAQMIAAGQRIISGGARGIDSAAMRGALAAGGEVVAVLAERLDQFALQREWREPLQRQQLLLLIATDPRTGFHKGLAMARNKLIYAFADRSVVMQSGVTGGTWEGAKEQLKDPEGRRRLYLWGAEPLSAGLAALQQQGAALFEPNLITQPQPATLAAGSAPSDLLAPPAPISALPEPPLPLLDPSEPAPPSSTVEPAAEPATPIPEPPPATTAAERLFAAAERELIHLLAQPQSEAELAATLQIHPTQLKLWLKRLLETDRITQTARRPLTYQAKTATLLGQLERHSEPPAL